MCLNFQQHEDNNKKLQVLQHLFQLLSAFLENYKTQHQILITFLILKEDRILRFQVLESAINNLKFESSDFLKSP